MTKEIAVVIGTRPEAVKMAPVVMALEGDPRFRVHLIATAQHRSLLDQVLDHFGLEAEVDLDIMTEEQSLTDVASRALTGLEPVFSRMHPDLVLVHGDTSTTFMGALAAFYQRIPSAHVEAGLRSGDMMNPFPEEANRKLVAQLASIHFAPTGVSRENLLREGIEARRIFVTGNTAIDALYLTAARRRSRPEGDLILVECHRRENLGEPHRQSFLGLRDVLEERAEAEVVFSVHPNPSVQRVASEVFDGSPRARLIDPPPYPEWVRLMARATVLVTDSGGAQEEAPALGVPVILIRRTTERPEAIAAGTVLRVDPGREGVRQAVRRVMSDEALYKRMAGARNPYGDGHAAERIVGALAYVLGMGASRPGAFGG